jgi:peptidyl-prolyl cis-trans isomerase SurA
VELAKELLFTMQDHTYSVGDFLTYAQHNQKPNALSPVDYLHQLYNNFVDDKLISALEEKIKRQNPDYTWLLKEYYEGILLFEIMEKEVWNKASEDSVGQQQYFKSHQSAYRAGERIKGNIYSAPAQDVLEKLKLLIEQGDSIKIQEFISDQKIRREVGAFEKSDRPVLSKINWQPGVYRAENNGLNYLVWVKTILRPGPLSFDEARPSVISDYQNYLEKNWIEKLRKKYPVKVNKKGKEFMNRQLIKP